MTRKMKLTREMKLGVLIGLALSEGSYERLAKVAQMFGIENDEREFIKAQRDELATKLYTVFLAEIQQQHGQRPNELQ